MKHRTIRAAAALTLGASLLTGTALAAGVTFSDVPSSHWAYKYVTRAADKGLVSGIGDGLYGESKELSTAEFATMACKMFYPTAPDLYKNNTSYWWYSYMEAAYQKGLLTGTTAGDLRTSSRQWKASVVEAGMTRYDMAQIIYNISQQQGWGNAGALDLLYAKAAISDWDKIPSKYQTAVVQAYAKKFVTGMADGSFSGDTSMTRAQAAVVLCALMDSKTEIDTPTFTNKNGTLVNGKDATEKNVAAALSSLQFEYFQGSSWNSNRVYTSTQLGSGSGNKGFAYMLSDRVFGNLSAEKVTDASKLKVGDLVYLNSEGWYVVVTDVSKDAFNYVYCDNNGSISWRGKAQIDDLGRKDSIYTRYEDKNATNSGTGAITEDEVDEAIDELYEEWEGLNLRKKWDDWDSYKSSVLGRGSKGQGFIYYLSDEIFGEREEKELDYDDLDEAKDVRIGDVIYLDEDKDKDDEVYGLVYKVKKDDIYFYYVDSDDELDSTSVSFDKLKDYHEITVYTRYEDKKGSIKESEVEDLIDKFLKKKVSVGDDWSDWDEYDDYDSEIFGKNNDGAEAFAYYMSDYIFEDREYISTKGSKLDAIEDIRLGDIIYLDDDSTYGVVTSLSSSKIHFVYVDDDDYVAEGSCRFSKLSSSDRILSRY